VSTEDIATLLDRLLPEVLERFLVSALGAAMPRLGDGDRYSVLSAGRFSGRLVGDLLGHAANQRSDAALLVIERDTLRVLYFRGGLVIGADSNVLFERLGRILGREGVLNDEDARLLIGMEERSGVAAAAALLPEEAASWGLERRLWNIGCALYLMAHAHFILLDGEPDLGVLPAFAVPPMELAMEGLRRYDEWRGAPPRTPAHAAEPPAAPQPARPRAPAAAPAERWLPEEPL
jgi:hypothetical protein